MLRTILSLSGLAALCALPAAAQQPADSGAFIVQLGKDTLVIERFVRTGNVTVAEALTRSPTTALRHYRLETDGHQLVRYVWEDRALPGTKPARLVRETLVFAGDTALITTEADSTITRRVALRRDVVPFLNLVHWPYELLTMRAVAAGRDSVALPFLSGRSAPEFMFTRLGRDSLLIRHPSRGTMRARIDERGRLLGLDGIATTLKLKVTRVPWPDLDRFAAAYAAEAARRPSELSPRGETRVVLGGANFTIDYGRPMKRGRDIFGHVVPWGQLWRTGANRATHFTTDRDLLIADRTLPAGTYTLFSIPHQNSWTLIINRQTGQNGQQYDAAQDFGRFEIRTRRLDHVVEAFTIDVAPARDGAELRLRWDATEAYLPFRIK